MRGTEHNHHEVSSPSSSAASLFFSSSMSLAFRSGRSLIRRNQVVSMENSQTSELQEIDIFHNHVADRLTSLLEQRETPKFSFEGNKFYHHQRLLLGIPFIRKLLDAFLYCDGEFKTLLYGLLARSNAEVVARPPVDRLVSDHLDRSIKSLDICNAVTHSLDSLRHSQRNAIIVVEALGRNQFTRAKSALSKLLGAISERPPAERIWSFGRSSRGSNSSSNDSSPRKHPQRTLSLIASKNRSAAKQLQAMMVTLHPPRGGEGGVLALAIYTMSSLLIFVMWVLVALFPSSERSQAPPFPSPPRQLPWAGPLMSLHEKIVEDWRNKERKEAMNMMPSGMLAELQGLERCGKSLEQLLESVSSPVAEGRAEGIALDAGEMAELCRMLEEEVGPLRSQVREVFQRVVRTRTELVELTVRGN